MARSWATVWMLVGGKKRSKIKAQCSGLFRQYVATEGRYQEGSLEKGPDCDLAPNSTAHQVHVFECEESRKIFVCLSEKSASVLSSVK